MCAPTYVPRYLNVLMKLREMAWPLYVYRLYQDAFDSETGLEITQNLTKLQSGKYERDGTRKLERPHAEILLPSDCS